MSKNPKTNVSVFVFGPEYLIFTKCLCTVFGLVHFYIFVNTINPNILNLYWYPYIFQKKTWFPLFMIFSLSHGAGKSHGSDFREKTLRY